jgi:hypothetical protein
LEWRCSFKHFTTEEERSVYWAIIDAREPCFVDVFVSLTFRISRFQQTGKIKSRELIVRDVDVMFLIWNDCFCSKRLCNIRIDQRCIILARFQCCSRFILRFWRNILTTLVDSAFPQDENVEHRLATVMKDSESEKSLMNSTSR